MPAGPAVCVTVRPFAPPPPEDNNTTMQQQRAYPDIVELKNININTIYIFHLWNYTKNEK